MFAGPCGQVPMDGSYIEGHIPHSQSDSTIVCHAQGTDPAHLAHKPCKIMLVKLTTMWVQVQYVLLEWLSNLFQENHYDLLELI